MDYLEFVPNKCEAETPLARLFIVDEKEVWLPKRLTRIFDAASETLMQDKEIPPLVGEDVSGYRFEAAEWIIRDIGI